jgi:hypothetical protein
MRKILNKKVVLDYILFHYLIIIDNGEILLKNYKRWRF